MRSWDDGVVVFDAVSGDTHLLSQFAGEILQLLEQRPLTSVSLARELAKIFTDWDEDEAPAVLESVLSELQNIDLIRGIQR